MDLSKQQPSFHNGTLLREDPLQCYRLPSQPK